MFYRVPENASNQIRTWYDSNTTQTRRWWSTHFWYYYVSLY